MPNPYDTFDDYDLRYFPAHLVDIEKWDILEHILTDLYFVEAKCRAGMTYDLVTDYVRARETLPGLKEEAQQEREMEEAGQRYGDELVAYAKAYIKRRRLRREYLDICTAESEQSTTHSRITTRLKDQLVRRQQKPPKKQKAGPSPIPALPTPPAC